jgi:hypothetical protein
LGAGESYPIHISRVVKSRRPGSAAAEVKAHLPSGAPVQHVPTCPDPAAPRRAAPTGSYRDTLAQTTYGVIVYGLSDALAVCTSQAPGLASIGWSFLT